jgi:hypothetical protein
VERVAVEMERWTTMILGCVELRNDGRYMLDEDGSSLAGSRWLEKR